MKNKKGTSIPGQLIVSVAAILFASAIFFYFIMVFMLGVSDETEESRVEMEESIQTSNILLSLLEREDVNDSSYAYLIQRSLQDSDWYAYTEPLIRDWLEDNLGSSYSYFFYVSYDGDAYFNMSGTYIDMSYFDNMGEFYIGEIIGASLRAMGIREQRQSNVILPYRDGKTVEVVLITW